MNKLTILGAGSAFTTKDWQTNYMITSEDGKSNMLIDCGGDVRHALNNLGMSYKDITDVFISHLHNDHIGGLEWLGFTKYFDPTQNKPKLWITADQKDDLWTHALSAGMSSIQGKIVGLDDYFEVHSLQANEKFDWHDIILQPVQTVHIMNGFKIVPSYGLLIKPENGKTIFVTADTQFAPHQIKDFYAMADIILHDCETLYFPNTKGIKDWKNQPEAVLKSGVHAHYEDLKTLDANTKSKMWLTHYQDNNPHSNDDVIADGFLGLGVAGQVIEF